MSMIHKIDQIWVFPQGNKNHVKIRGWVVARGGAEPVVEVVEAPYLEMLNIQNEDRLDVAKKYSQYEDAVESGFVCQFAYATDVAKDKKVELFVAFPESGKQENFFSISLKQLEKELVKPGIQYRIEQVDYAMGRMSVTGWAYAISKDGSCRKPAIRITDAYDRELEVKVNDVKRLDVNQLTGLQQIEGELGYQLEWLAAQNASYKITFQDEDVCTQVSVSEKGVKKASYYFKKIARKGIRGVKKVLRMGQTSYDLWERAHRVTEAELAGQRETTFEQMPKISIIVPAYRTPEKFLREMIDSVRAQSYQNWELCVADGSLDDSIFPVLEEYKKKDARVRYAILDDNYGISGNTNKALELATGDYVALLDHDDLLTPDALYEVVKCINETGADVVYTDEDKVTMDLKEYFDPHFKSDFNQELLRSCNYICHFFIVKNTVLKQVGLFREECNGSQDFDFILRCTSTAEKVAHVAKIVYHWRCHPNSTAANPQSKMYCYEAGKRALEFHLEECKIENAKVTIEPHFGYYRITYPVVQPVKIGVIILGEAEEQYQATVESLKTHTKGITYEVIRAESGKGVAVACNQAVAKTEADYIIFLQAGMTVTQDDWAEIMVANCQRQEIGAVGALVMVQGRYVGHSGKLLGAGTHICRDMFWGREAEEVGYAGRKIAQQSVSAISWKGMMIRRSTYLEMGGFDETYRDLYMDIDLCLKLQEQGKRIVCTPYTSFEIERKIFKEEPVNNKEDEELLRGKWEKILEKGDPFYNRNFDKEGEPFTLSYK